MEPAVVAALHHPVCSSPAIFTCPECRAPPDLIEWEWKHTKTWDAERGEWMVRRELVETLVRGFIAPEHRIESLDESMTQ